MGWKIHVLDTCDERAAASDIQPVVVPAPKNFAEESNDDLEESPSIQIETRVKPNVIITVDKEDNDSKSVISETKVTDNLPSSTPSPTTEQTSITSTTTTTITTTEHASTTPVTFTFAPPQLVSVSESYAKSPASLYQHLHKLHKQQPNEYYLRPSQPLPNFYNTYQFSPPSNTTIMIQSTVPVTLPTIPKLIASTIILNDSFFVPPVSKFPSKFNYPMLPRPISRSPYPKRSIPMKFIGRHPNIPHMRLKHFEKYLPRYPYPSARPYNFEFVRPLKQQVLSIMAQSLPLIARPLPHPINLPIQDKTMYTPIKEINKVQISPQQAPTEREPEIQTASSTTIVDFTPKFIQVRPAINTGFRPSSVQMETGFKPIITKELQERMDQADDDGIEIRDEGEIGVIDKDIEDNYGLKPVHVFEPMFFPSPTDKFAKDKVFKINKRFPMKKRQQYVKVVIKKPRSINTTEDELLAEANERSETYYLPPKGQMPVNVVQQHSNIDIELPESDLHIDSPPDVVVTYDGKKVSGQSLTAKISDRPSILDSRISKASSFIKARPQFVKYTGELPPLNPELLFGGVPQRSSGVLSRELDTPELPPAGTTHYTSTRLSRITREQNEGKREKREAHHTPEHTAEQQRQNKTKTSGAQTTANIQVSVFLVCLASKYFLLQN